MRATEFDMQLEPDSELHGIPNQQGGSALTNPPALVCPGRKSLPGEQLVGKELANHVGANAANDSVSNVGGEGHCGPVWGEQKEMSVSRADQPSGRADSKGWRHEKAISR